MMKTWVLEHRLLTHAAQKVLPSRDRKGAVYFNFRKRVLVIGLAAAVSGGLSGAARRSLPWEKNHLQIGRALYRENCVVCHDIDRAQSKKTGPSFYQLFKRDKMPLANMKVNRDYIKVRVKFGGALMPAFRQRLSDAEINTLIDYVASQ